ncbi:MAG: hypothetical protein D8M57_10765 [Candidatus Scalindua sp. AMX11]|nr:MAG: hypothetical protein DWQ00_03240 [Candidatus Scalindua sp.]NOG83112.1 hypothetical protein [Planctomycetota bacterium]RZV75870.1 MAG: hypothetical protein EX341_12540 [Candidatus Scalindua sp. SCAELEC01]TDE64929.1 MAG: hypothetical protein D8M57_10765 [Candidatus Scalindua sp. AMX11]GJQ60224.1 MAG: hypothetical protein SCALA701_30250 [Candidatus Scalindua sp.]
MQNVTLKKALSLLLLLSLSSLLFIHVTKAETDSLESAKRLLDEGIRTYDTKKIEEAKEIFIAQAGKNSTDYQVDYYVALAYLALCDMENFEMRKCQDKREKNIRKEERVKLAGEGIAYADRSLALKEDFSESHRVKGALLSNKISGMVSGMRNGKLAEVEVLRALEIDNKNVMAQIENARRFINKPRLLGGSVTKGIEILKAIIEEHPALEKGYLNLGIAYYESGEEEWAAETFKKLLEINPDNTEAKFFVNHLRASK